MEQIRNQAVASLQAQGWTRDQALGIAANLEHESRYNPGAIGDGGKAYGIAQWHPDRQAAFQERYGKSIRGSSLDEQLAFLTYEMREGKEQSAGRRLAAATGAADAAAIVSRFYERPLDTEGEANRRGALAAKLAGVPFVAQAPGSMLRTASNTPRPADDTGWPVLPTAQAARAAASNVQLVDTGASLLAARAQINGADASAPQSRAEFDAIVRIQNEEQSKMDATGFGDAFDAARHDKRIQATFNLLDRYYAEDDGPVPEGWTYDSVRDKVEGGLSDDQREYLRENGQASPAALARAQAELKYRQDLDRTYGYAGGFASFAGQMAGGMMDPVSLMAGIGVGKALQLAGVGSSALANAGRVAAARASFVGENIIGNVGIEAMQDAMGEVKTSGDYAMAAASGALMATPFLPFIHPAVKAVDDSLVEAANKIKRDAERQQAEAVAEKISQGMSPSDAAKAVIREETDRILGETNSNPGQRREQAIPKEAADGLRAEVDGTVHTDMEGQAQKPVTPDGEEPPPVITEPAPERTPEQVQKAVEDSVKGQGERTLGTTKEGAEVQYTWTVNRNAQKGDSSLFDTLTAVSKSENIPAQLKAAVKYFLDNAQRLTLGDVKVRVSTMREGSRKLGSFAAGNQRVTVNVPKGERTTFNAAEFLKGANESTLKTLVHETTHALTVVKMHAYKHGLLPKDSAVIPAMKELEEVFNRYKELTKGIQNHNVRYAATNVEEFIAQAWSMPEVQRVLTAMPGVEGKPIKGSAWNRVLKAISKMLFDTKGHKGRDNSAMGDVIRLTDTIIRASDVTFRDGAGIPIYAATLPPQVLSAARFRRLQSIVSHAIGVMTRSPIDPGKLNTLTKYVQQYGGMSDGLVLASSKNPVVQMIASLVTEVTTGAAGRKATVAIRARTLEQRLLGNGLLDYQNYRNAWHKTQGSTAKDRLITGDADRAFGKAVMEEIQARRQAGYNNQHADPNVVKAADSLERGFQRAADEQRFAGTLGADRLATSSKGYIPQALDGAKLAALAEDAAAYDAFRAELARQFEDQLGFDPQFAATFSLHYLERVRRRAMGDKSMDALAAAGDGMSVVRDTLNDMGVDPAMRDRAAAASAAIGQGHTKKRLDIDMTAPFGNGTVGDLYVQDPVALYRRYMRGTSGNIALTESGILGIHGVRELRSAASTAFPGVAPASLPELQAMDRVFAEILGTPVAGEIISSGATNLSMIVGLQRLGGLVFTQASEAWNMLHHVGLSSTLKGVASLPRMISEVRESYKTGSVMNPVLRSMEVYSTEFGMDGYKTVMPLDAPDARVSEYMQQPSVLSRLVRAGGHVQAVATGFRALLAAQHRMAAEQITLRALRMIRDGGSSKALADMGFTADVVAGMQADLNRAVTWGRDGNVQSLDITQISDPMVREAFVQAVHRGTSQIIQGTFVGERNAWVHNDYLRVLMQLRQFGMTAMEKQWSRTRMNQGFYTAAGMMLVQIGMAIPLHLARVQLAAAGREDRKQYLKDNTSPAAIMRAAMNYASLTGLTGDALEAISGIAGGWGDDATKEMLGARQGASGVGRVIPAAGSIDQLIRVATGKADLHTGLKQLPFSSVWYLQPLLNLTKEQK